MPLTLIIGPMKSGKSLELIARMSKYEHTSLRTVLVQPKLNVRDKGVRTRLGLELDALKVDSLSNVKADNYDVIGVDEAFMFGADSVPVIKEWLIQEKDVLLSSLDVSAMGNLTEFVAAVLELKPDELVLTTSVCELCKTLGAQFTQIYTNKGQPITEGLPDVVPEDGTYLYRPVCRSCFFTLQGI